MKSLISAAGIPSLLLALASASVALSQNETNGPTAFQTAAPRLPAESFLPNLQPSHWTTEMIRLAQSGIDESVMLAFVGNSGAFSLAADHIVYLSDLGVSGQVISAMLRHDQELALKQRLPVAGSEIATITAIDRVATNSAVARPTQAGHATAVGMDSLSDVKSSSPNPQLVALLPVAPQPAEPIAPSVSIEPRPAPPKKKKLYPVREPYPVELTAPIVFLDAPSF